MSQRDPLILRDGIANLDRGMDSGRAPNLLPRNQAAYLQNVTVRGDFAQTRPGWAQVKLLYYSDNPTEAQIAYNAIVTRFRTKKFQGASYYDDGTGEGAMVVQSGGYLYYLKFINNVLVVSDISVTNDLNSEVFARVYMQQAEQYMIVQDSQSKPIIFDGSVSRRSLTDEFEVPIGSGPMAYGMGRLWIAQGRQYVGGDLFNSDTGVLKFTENESIAEGGAFPLPLLAGNITGMSFVSQPDTALGQGELLIFTPDAVFSDNVPIDREDWLKSSTPLQTIVLQTCGAMGQWAIQMVNSDVFFRSRVGINTIIQARREFNSWGNVPVSREMNRVMLDESQALLRYASAIVFDNRYLITSLPQPLSNQCYFQGIVALDFDLISSMGQRQPPAYDGLWMGPCDPYQIIKGRFNGVERAFIFAKSHTNNYIESINVDSDSLDTFNFIVGVTPIPVSFLGGGGVDAAAEIEFGFFSTVAIVNGGTGYSPGDIVVVDNTGATYTEAFTVQVVFANPITGEVAMAVVLNYGRYTVAPTDLTAMAQVTTNGSGVGLVIGVNTLVLLRGISVTNAGKNYTSAPVATCQFEISPGTFETLTFGVTLSPQLEIWEISKNLKFDYPLDTNDVPVETSITSIMETFSMGFAATNESSIALAKRLESGRLHVDKVAGTVNFTLQFRPDQHPCWQDWYSWSICAAKCAIPATVSQASMHILTEDFLVITDEDGNPIVTEPDTTTDCNWHIYAEQYRPRMTIPQPQDDIEDISSGMPTRIGREFQARLQWEGFCRIKLLELKALDVQEEVNPPVVEVEAECREVECACD